MTVDVNAFFFDDWVGTKLAQSGTKSGDLEVEGGVRTGRALTIAEAAAFDPVRRPPLGRKPGNKLELWVTRVEWVLARATGLIGQ